MDETTWVKVHALRWNLMLNGFVVGSVWPVDDGIKASVWPLGNASVEQIEGTFISVPRAQEAVEQFFA